jgi:hypothetical protein
MRVEDLFKRLKREYLKVRVLQSFLDTLIVVLSLNFAAFIASYSYDLRALGLIGFAFFLTRFYQLSRGYSVELYEEKNQRLDELLRTAEDNLDRRDEITQALFNDVMERARKVSSESIIPSERIFQKLFLVGGLAILTAVSGLVAPAIDIDYSGFENPFSDISDIGDEEVIGNASEVMGEPTEIDTTGTNVNITVEGEGESLDEGFRRGLENQELRFEASDDELDEDLELAQRYSLAIRNLE